MTEYHKIQTVYLRNPETKFKTLLEGQLAKPEFEYLKNNKWICTEKVDGTNIRIIKQNNKLIFKGKSDNAQIPTFLNESLEKLFNIEKLIEIFNDVDICLYGEGYGNKIQKCGNIYLSDTTSFILFDIKIGNYFLNRNDIEEIADKLNINIVPIVCIDTLLNAIDIVKNKYKSLISNQIAEGLVMKPEIELYNRQGKRVITKIKSKDFI